MKVSLTGLLLITIYFLTNFEMCFSTDSNEDYLLDTEIESSVMLAIDSKCVTTIRSSEDYSRCKQNAISRSNQTSNETLVSDCCLNWQLLDCFDTYAKHLCPNLNIRLSDQQWSDLVTHRHNCSAVGAQYEQRYHRCGIQFPKRLVKNDWKIMFFAIVISLLAMLTVFMMKYKANKEKKKYFQSLPVQIECHDISPNT